MRLMPRSSTTWIVRTDSSSSAPPHWNPPMAHVPRPTRLTGIVMSGILVVSISIRTSSPSRAVPLVLLDGVHGRARTLTGQHAHHFIRRDGTHQADRLLGVVGRVRGHDHVVEVKQGTLRPPIAMLRGFLFEVIERRSGDPALGEGPVERTIADDRPTRGIDQDGAPLH